MRQARRSQSRAGESVARAPAIGSARTLDSPAQLQEAAIEPLLGICMGIGLAAAVGFRVFLPPLVLGAAAALGMVELPESLEWLASGLALTAFSAALLLELGAYAIPWVDHLLDMITTPLAVVAGTLLAASFLAELPPLLQWTLAIVAGGGASATTQGVTTAGRGASTVTTGGLANPLVSLGEAVASLVTTILTIFVPIAVALVVAALAVFVAVRLRSRQATNPH